MANTISTTKVPFKQGAEFGGIKIENKCFVPLLPNMNQGPSNLTDVKGIYYGTIMIMIIMIIMIKIMIIILPFNYKSPISFP